MITLAQSRSDEKEMALAKLITEQLFDNALMAAGLIEDARDMIPRINEILANTLFSFTYKLHSNFTFFVLWLSLTFFILMFMFIFTFLCFILCFILSFTALRPKNYGRNFTPDRFRRGQSQMVPSLYAF